MWLTHDMRDPYSPVTHSVYLVGSHAAIAERLIEDSRVPLPDDTDDCSLEGL